MRKCIERVVTTLVVIQLVFLQNTFVLWHHIFRNYTDINDSGEDKAHNVQNVLLLDFDAENISAAQEVEQSTNNTSKNNSRVSAPSSMLDHLYVLPYMESTLERHYIETIHALISSRKFIEPHRKGASKEEEGKSVISFSVYHGDVPKYVQGAIENAKLLETYFPGWIVRFYTLPAPDFPQSTIDQFKKLGAEVVHPPSDLRLNKFGMFWRFLVADDPSVSRFILRDSDSRLNARDRFAVEEWMMSGKQFHIVRDHPFHERAMNGGLWGGSNTAGYGVHQNKSMLDLIRTYKRKSRCPMVYNCDNRFLDKYLWEPLIKDNHIAHDSYFCQDPRYPNGVGLPTARDSNLQHVGQVFNETNEPEEGHFSFFAETPMPKNCSRDTEPKWLIG